MLTLYSKRFRTSLITAFYLSWTIAGAPAVAADRDIDGVHIPDTAKVEPPSSSALEAHRAFSGAWVGSWSGFLKSILVVESIGSDGRASVIYAWGDNPRLNIKRGWRRETARVTGETLTIATDFRAEYKLSAPGMATGSWQRGESRAGATLLRKELSAISTPAARVSWGSYQSQLLATNLREDGKAIRLEAVIYRPPGKGPFPLAVLNHGSTGRGDQPERFKDTFVMYALAHYLVDKGWVVAFPQRRGRGKSEGLYDEGFLPDRSQYACHQQLSLAGAERALTDLAAAMEALRQLPDVQAGPVLMGGVSRGGILSVAYAGRHPHQVKGVLNFVGGWMGTQCSIATQINEALFRPAGKYTGSTLWLYGDKDLFYSLTHSRENFQKFQAAGGKGQFVELPATPNQNGHTVHLWPALWLKPVDDFLQEIAGTR